MSFDLDKSTGLVRRLAGWLRVAGGSLESLLGAHSLIPYFRRTSQSTGALCPSLREPKIHSWPAGFLVEGDVTPLQPLGNRPSTTRSKARGDMWLEKATCHFYIPSFL